MRLLVRAMLTLLLAGVPAVGGFAAAPAAPAPVVWQRVESPHFLLLSSATDRETLDWAVELELFLSLLEASVPVDAKSRAPFTVLLFKDDEALAPYKPDMLGGRSSPSSAYFWHNSAGAVIALSPRQNPIGTRRLIYHDGMHWLMGRLARRNPVWFEEGFAELFSSFAITPNAIALGLPVDPHVARLRQDGLIPTEELLRQNRSSLLYNEATRDSRLYAQAWLMVHALFFEQDQSRLAGIKRYLTDTRQGVAGAEAFENVFGLSPGEMDQRLIAYLKSGKFGVRRMGYDRGAVEKRLRRGPAEPWEPDFALGVLAHYSGHKDEALRLLTAASEKNPTQPRVHFWLGDLALARKDNATAKANFDRAVAHGAGDYASYYWRAVAMLRVARPDNLLSGIDPLVLRAAADDAVQAIQFSPWERNAYELHASLLQVIATPIDSDRETLEAALDRWPDSPLFLVSAAIVNDKAQHRAEARSQLERLLALEPPAPARFRDFASRQITGWERQAQAETERQRGDEIARLMAEKDYAKLHVRVAEILREAAPADRAKWEKFAEQARLHEKLDSVDALLKDDRREDAVSILHEVASSNVIDLMAKSQAREMLKKLGH
jgi:hypothetical protein